MERHKGEVDSFLILLTIALIVLVVLTAVFGVFGGQLGATTTRPLATLADVGRVGFLTDLPVNTYSLSPFTAGIKQLDTLRTIPEIEIVTGAGGGRGLSLPVTVPSYYGETLTGIKLSFDVYRPGTGAIRVKWNSKEILTDILSARPYTIFIPKDDVKVSNALEIFADGPGLAFWATNSYTLRDTKVQVEYGPAKLVALELGASDLQAFTRGEISFYSLGETGTLTVSVNNVPAFSGQARGPRTVNFTLTSVPLTIGNNVISFSASGGSFDIRNGEIRIYTASNQQVSERSFNLSVDQLAPISTGTISLTLSTVTRPGSIRAFLNSRQIFSQQMEPGTLTGSFQKETYQPGINTLQLTGTGSAQVDTVTLGGT